MTDRPATSTPAGAAQRDEPRPQRGRRLPFLVPAVAFLGVAVLLGWGLTRKPREIPSALLEKPVPTFSLPPVQGRALGLSSTDLKGEVSLVNVFASWCAACREEHPLLMALAAAKVIPIHGLNYKDAPENAARWLDQTGDPYTRTGADVNGRVGIEWGVYGVPETFVVSADGRIAYKHIGALTQRDLDEKLMPLVDRLRRQSQEPRP